jgi:hypothetical protein
MTGERTLLAIKYTRGSLELLDQRLLPLESVYLPVKNNQDAWTMIRVREEGGADRRQRYILSYTHPLLILPSLLHVFFCAQR